MSSSSEKQSGLSLFIAIKAIGMPSKLGQANSTSSHFSTFSILAKSLESTTKMMASDTRHNFSQLSWYFLSPPISYNFRLTFGLKHTRYSIFTFLSNCLMNWLWVMIFQNYFTKLVQRLSLSKVHSFANFMEMKSGEKHTSSTLNSCWSSPCLRQTGSAQRSCQLLARIDHRKSARKSCKMMFCLILAIRQQL